MRLVLTILALTLLTKTFGQCSETESSFKEYVRKNIQTIDPIEGIWTVTSTLKIYDANKRVIDSYEGQGQVLNIAIKRQGDKFTVCGLPRDKVDKSIETFTKTATKGLYLYHHQDRLDNIDSKSTGQLTSFGTMIYSFEPFTEARVRQIAGRDYQFGMKVFTECSAIKIFPTEDDFVKNVPQKSSGTGFSLTKDGLIVTNYHVVDGAKSVKILGVNGDFSNAVNAKVVLTDANNDLALLKIDDKNFNLINKIPFVIKTVTSDVGESVTVLGYPLRATMGDEIKLTTGIISSKTGFKGDVTSYQISAPIQPGNSGGPMFDSQGNLIGIINAKHSGAENASYAIKTNYLLNLLELLPVQPLLNKTNLVAGKSLPEQIQLLKQGVYIIETTTDEN